MRLPLVAAFALEHLGGCLRPAGRQFAENCGESVKVGVAFAVEGLPEQVAQLGFRRKAVSRGALLHLVRVVIIYAVDPGQFTVAPICHSLGHHKGCDAMKIKRIEHVAVAVKDMQASIALLRDAFGLTLEYEEKIGDIRLAMLPVGQTYIELLDGVSRDSSIGRQIPEQGEGLFHLCFEVDDIDGALAELKQKGVKLIDETPRIGHGGCRIAFIDPSATGNLLIELAQLPEGH